MNVDVYRFTIGKLDYSNITDTVCKFHIFGTSRGPYMVALPVIHVVIKEQWKSASQGRDSSRAYSAILLLKNVTENLKTVIFYV